jgi:hypothetical protein
VGVGRTATAFERKYSCGIKCRRRDLVSTAGLSVDDGIKCRRR